MNTAPRGSIQVFINWRSHARFSYADQHRRRIAPFAHGRGCAGPGDRRFFTSSSPRPHTVISGNVPLDVRCFATSTQECQRLCVEVEAGRRRRALASTAPRAPPPGTLMLLTRPFPAFESGGRAHAHDLWQCEAQALRPRRPTDRSTSSAARSSSRCIASRARSSIFDADRVLFLSQFQSLGILDRASQQVSWLATLPQDPPGSTPTYGALTPSAPRSSRGTVASSRRSTACGPGSPQAGWTR